MKGKIFMVFSAPALMSVFQNIVYNTPVDLTMVIVAVATSLVGSTMQITHKNLDLKKKKEDSISSAEIYAIYITGIVFGLIAYMVGQEKKNLLYTMIIGVFGSYMSLDLFAVIKTTILKGIPKIFDALIDNYVSKKNDKDK